MQDTAGQERYGSLTRGYYKNAIGCIIVFDISRSSTFDAVLKWKADLDSQIQLPDEGTIPCLLLTNKVRDEMKQDFQ